MKRLTISGLILMVGLIGVGCAAAAPTPPTPTPATGGPGDPPVTQWSDVSTQVQPTLAPTAAGQINYEPTAAAAGSVPYSGNACSFGKDKDNKDVCTCETATVIKASFTFQPGDKMTYEFHGDTYGSSWQMTRLAANQWSYIIPIGLDETGTGSTQAGQYITILTFTEIGFTLQQSQDHSDGTQLTCPAVTYKRLTAAP